MRLLWGKTLRSPHAHAEIARLETEAGTLITQERSYYLPIECFLEMGDMESARHDLEAFGTLAEASRQRYLRWVTTLGRCMLALVEGRFDDAERLVRGHPRPDLRQLDVRDVRQLLHREARAAHLELSCRDQHPQRLARALLEPDAQLEQVGSVAGKMLMAGSPGLRHTSRVVILILDVSVLWTGPLFAMSRSRSRCSSVSTP